MKNFLKTLSFSILCSTIIFSCGNTNSKLKGLVDKADSLGSQLEEVSGSLLDSMENYAENIPGLDEIANAGNSDEGDINPLVTVYEADELWKKAVKEVEKGKENKPKKGIKEIIIKTNKGEVSDQSGAKIYGDIYFTELDSFLIWPTKVDNNGEINNLEDMPEKPDDKMKASSEKYKPLYTSEEALINVLLENWQDKIFVQPTNVNKNINTIDCKEYAFTFQRRDGKYMNGYAYIDSKKATPVKLVYYTEHNTASGGVFYTFKNVSGYTVIDTLSVNVAINMGNFGGFDNIMQLNFTEYEK